MKKCIFFMVACAIVVSCTKKNGGGGLITPNPTPTASLPKINTFTPALSTITLTYTGMPSPGTVAFSWETVNGFTTFDGSTVNATGSSAPIVPMSGKTYSLSVTDGAGHTDQQSRTVVVAIDPTFEKICGATGQSWKTTRNTSYRISDGNLLELLQPSELDDVFTFYPNANWKVDFGTLNPQTTVEEEFRFNSSMNEIATQPYTLQPVRKVEFTSPTMMTWTYTKNGSIYTRYFVKI